MHSKGSFLRPSGPPSDPTRKHLHIALTEPYGPSEFVLCVSVASIRTEYYDDTCILMPGVHEFVVHPSYVVYRSMVEIVDHYIETCLSSGEFVRKADVSDEIFERIVAGANCSPQTPRFAKEALNDRNNQN